MHRILGFEHNPSGSTVMVLDFLGPFAETSKGLTKEKLLANGVEVKQIETMTFNDVPAPFMTGETELRRTIHQIRAHLRHRHRDLYD